MHFPRIFNIFIFILPLLVASCIDDDITTAPSAQPEYSVDTLRIGYTFTEHLTPTRSFKVYNRNDKGIVISKVAISDGSMADCFRINVDGVPGPVVTDVEVRARDSVFVMVEAVMPRNGFPGAVATDVKLDFEVNGVSSYVVLNVVGEDVVTLDALTVTGDMRLTSEYPYNIKGELLVNEGATLTVDAGARLYFHDKAGMRIDGTLVCEGTPDEPVDMAGDRFDMVVGGIPYEIMSGQWQGVTFGEGSRNNRLSHTVIRNMVEGVRSSGELNLINCRLRNSQGPVLDVDGGTLRAVGCEVAEGGEGVLAMNGGSCRLDRCTIANYYLFSAPGGAIVGIGEADDVHITNSIIYGLGESISPAKLDKSPVVIERCLLGDKGSDDDNFLRCIWDSDPLFYTVREDYLFDYRVQDASPAYGMSDPEVALPESETDFYGVSRNTLLTLGAFVSPGQK